jgi:predicted RND superfamily exporter protein
MVMQVLGKKVSSHPKTTIIATILITLIAVGCIQIIGINQEFSEESFMPEMEVVKASEEISNNYTGSYTVSILVKSRNEDLLTSDGLVEILRVEKAIIEDPLIIPILDTPEAPSVSINSIADNIAQMALIQQNVTLPTIEQKIVTLQNMNDNQIKQLITNILTSNQTPLEIKGMFSVILTKDFNLSTGNIKAQGTIIMVSLNASYSTGNIEMGSDASEGDLADTEKRMDEIVKKTHLTATRIRVMGNQIINNEIQKAASESMEILLPIAFGLVIVILALIYRNGLDMLFSILALVFAIIWVYGFGSAMGYTFNPMTTAVPVLIVGLGIDYGIHITMRYREEIKSRKKIGNAVVITIKSVGMALLLATVTTVAAFLSNLVSAIGLLAEFGVLCAIGIIGSFVTMTTFVPACKQLRDLRKIKNRTQRNPKEKNSKSAKKKNQVKGIGVEILNKTMSSGAVAAEHHPLSILILVSVITLGAGVGALSLETTFNFEDFLPEDMEITQDLNYLLNEFDIAGGQAQQVTILVKGDITDPGLLEGIMETIDNLRDTKYIIKNIDQPEVKSLLSVMTDWATNSTYQGIYDSAFDPAFKVLYSTILNVDGTPKPGTTKEDIKTLYDWLYSNSQSTKTTKSVLHKNNKGIYDGTVLWISVDIEPDNDEQIENLHKELKNDKKPLDDKTKTSIVTGESIVMKVVMDSLNESQIRSLIITIIMSFVILTIVFWFRRHSLILGAITLTPLIFCVIWTLGTMFFVNIPLNMMTITVASLTIGLGITYGIHITHRFLEDLENSKTIDIACRNTVIHTGTALFGAATTTIAGFGILVFALMPPLQQFGAITALTILYSFLSSVFILPTFLVMWAKWKKKNNEKAQDKKRKDKVHHISCPQCNKRVEVHESATKFNCPHCGLKADFC